MNETAKVSDVLAYSIHLLREMTGSIPTPEKPYFDPDAPFFFNTDVGYILNIGSKKQDGICEWFLTVDIEGKDYDGLYDLIYDASYKISKHFPGICFDYPGEEEEFDAESQLWVVSPWLYFYAVNDLHIDPDMPTHLYKLPLGVV